MENKSPKKFKKRKEVKSLNKALGKSFIRLPKDTTLDRIYASYLEDVELTDKEKEIRSRWSAVFTTLCSGKSHEFVKQFLMDTYGISDTVAYRDIKNAKLLFGDVTESSKKADAYILAEMAVKAYEVGLQESNADAMVRAVALMGKLKGVNDIDNSLINAEDFKQHTFIIGNFADQLGVKLPDNLPQLIESWIKTKKSKNLHISDAQIIDDEPGQ